jgi:hypothetical protein
LAPLRRLTLPLQSGAFQLSVPLSATYCPCVTQRIGAVAVLAGSNVSPVRNRRPPPLPACTVLMTVGAESVPSALTVKRWMSPVSVPA